MAAGKDQILEKIFEEFRSTISASFPWFAFITNVTESKNGSMYIMVIKKGGKILGAQKIKLFKTVKEISGCICKYYSQRSQFILMSHFPYFHLLRNYSNYHFHFLVVKNEYFYNDNFI